MWGSRVPPGFPRGSPGVPVVPLSITYSQRSMILLGLSYECTFDQVIRVSRYANISPACMYPWILSSDHPISHLSASSPMQPWIHASTSSRHALIHPLIHLCSPRASMYPCNHLPLMYTFYASVCLRMHRKFMAMLLLPRHITA